MTLGEIKDVVREHYGRIGWPTTMLDLALSSARRDVEKSGNYYWMRTTTTFNTTAATQTYPLTSGTINRPNFKDLRALHVKESGETLWGEVHVGNIPLEEAKLMFATDDEDRPELGVIDNATLHLFPIPDAAYNMALYTWEWTSNPSAGNTGSDELTNRFPEALIYGALVWGSEQFDKQYPEADRWRGLFAGELKKIQLHDFEREQKNPVSLIPMTGPFSRRYQRTTLPVWI